MASDFEDNDSIVSLVRPNDDIFLEISLEPREIILTCDGGIFRDKEDLSLNFYLFDSETEEKIESPRIDIFGMVDLDLFRLYSTSYYEGYNIAEYYAEAPRGIYYKGIFGANGYQEQTVFFRTPEFCGEDTIRVYLKRIK